MGWFQVFDATMIDRVLASFQPAACIERHFKYERDGWRLSSREASREATYFDYHAARRRHATDYAAAARAVVCLELIRSAPGVGRADHGHPRSSCPGP